MGFRLMQYHNTERLTDKSFIIKQLVAAPTYTRPFNAATYFCGMLPQHIYTQLIENFPPDKFFENYEVSSFSLCWFLSPDGLSNFALIRPTLMCKVLPHHSSGTMNAVDEWVRVQELTA